MSHEKGLYIVSKHMKNKSQKGKKALHMTGIQVSLDYVTEMLWFADMLQGIEAKDDCSSTSILA